MNINKIKQSIINKLEKCIFFRDIMHKLRSIGEVAEFLFDKSKLIIGVSIIFFLYVLGYLLSPIVVYKLTDDPLKGFAILLVLFVITVLWFAIVIKKKNKVEKLVIYITLSLVVYIWIVIYIMLNIWLYGNGYLTLISVVYILFIIYYGIFFDNFIINSFEKMIDIILYNKLDTVIEKRFWFCYSSTRIIKITLGTIIGIIVYILSKVGLLNSIFRNTFDNQYNIIAWTLTFITIIETLIVLTKKSHNNNKKNEN